MQAHHVVAARDAIGRRTRRLRPGPLGIATGLVLVGALLVLPGLAAANVLPDPTRHAVTTVLEKVGITVPANEDHPTAPTAPSVDHPASTGAEISSIATTTDATGVDKGAEISSVASGGMSRAGQHGGGTTVASSAAGAHGRQTAEAARDGAGPSTPGAAPAHP